MTASGTANEVSGETAPIKATYSFSVEHELITSSFGILSDLVLVGYDELYVTQVVTNTAPHHARVQEVESCLRMTLIEFCSVFDSRVTSICHLASRCIVQGCPVCSPYLVRVQRNTRSSLFVS